MSSQLDLALTPSAAAGLLSALPWALLSGFVVMAGVSGRPLLLIALPPLAFGAWRAYRRYGLLLGKRAVIGLKADSQGLHCALANGTETPVTLDGASSLGRSLLTLKFRPVGTMSGRLFTVIISKPGLLPANAQADDCRRLKMWLRAGHTLIPR